MHNSIVLVQYAECDVNGRAWTKTGDYEVHVQSGTGPGFLNGRDTGAEEMVYGEGVPHPQWGGDWRGDNAPPPIFLTFRLRMVHFAFCLTHD